MTGRLEPLVLPPAEIVGSEDKMEQLEEKAQVFIYFFYLYVLHVLESHFRYFLLSRLFARSFKMNKAV